MRNDSLRYARIKPVDIEGNLFMYHLRKVMAEGLVVKDGNQYCLTVAGRQFADRLSLKTFTPRVQPKIVTMVAAQNEANQWLLYRRTVEPLKSYVSFPYGKVHMGETFEDAAARELEEKAGFTAVLSRLGEVSLRIYEGELLISHLLCCLYKAEQLRGQLVTKGMHWECFWGSSTQAHAMPGFSKIVTLTESYSEPFFCEIVAKI